MRKKERFVFHLINRIIYYMPTIVNKKINLKEEKKNNEKDRSVKMLCIALDYRTYITNRE